MSLCFESWRQISCPVFLLYNLSLPGAISPLKLRSRWGHILFARWDWLPGFKFSREISTLEEVIWSRILMTTSFIFPGNSGRSFFFFWWIRAILVAPFKSAVHLALIAEYLDSETHCINGCLFSSLTSLSKIFPWSWFHYNLKNTICLSRSFFSLLWTDCIWFLSPGSIELLQVERVATVQLLPTAIFFHMIAGQLSGEFVSVNLGFCWRAEAPLFVYPAWHQHHLNHILSMYSLLFFHPYICSRADEVFLPLIVLCRDVLGLFVFCTYLFFCLWCSLLVCYMHSSDLCTTVEVPTLQWVQIFSFSF